ncbi:GNAT family N-acetyltransferase [Paralimibaculum aggregatum]|uniref:GNAT family N-acetyltransferase n=1 Tax=Paralimibaculum aggregatum TaxID=3036245 RepID=UPI00255637A1|nr:GNAT family protein [Limibaculum sp. NKW23]
MPGWTVPPPPSRETMTGRFVRLEPLSLDHAAALHAANREDAAGRIWDYLPYGPYADADSYRAWVREVARQPDPLFFALCVGGEPLGVASFLRIAPAAGSIELGHINLSPRLQRTPAATEAFSMMIAWAFRHGYRRFEWKCNAANRGSRRAAQRLGLSYEGVFRQATISKGCNRDTAWFAAIDSEWPALEAAHAAWLAPGNFDADGRQRQSLSTLTAPLLARFDPALADL